MKISELIEFLQLLKDKNGDVVIGYDGGVMTFDGTADVLERDGETVLSLCGEMN